MTNPDRTPRVNSQVVYISLTLGISYDARVTKVHPKGKAKNHPVDLVAYKPNERDEIWRNYVPFGDTNGTWSWPPAPDPEAEKK